jgi:hypothetical protein
VDEAFGWEIVFRRSLILRSISGAEELGSIVTIEEAAQRPRRYSRRGIGGTNSFRGGGSGVRRERAGEDWSGVKKGAVFGGC